jgi:hypothetical protein
MKNLNVSNDLIQTGLRVERGDERLLRVSCELTVKLWNIHLYQIDVGSILIVKTIRYFEVTIGVFVCSNEFQMKVSKQL